MKYVYRKLILVSNIKECVFKNQSSSEKVERVEGENIICLL